MAYGNTNVSSLVSAARATKAKQQAVNDQYYAYNWSTSEQTESEFNEYQKYLTERQKTTTDPSKKLSIQTKLNGARSSYTSNEIQRQTQAVMVGEQDNVAKYRKVEALWRAAQQSGNANLAQNLASQLIGLQKTIATEAEVAGNKARGEGEKAAEATFGYNKALLEKAELLAKEKVRNGEMSSTEFQDLQYTLMERKRSVYEAAGKGEFGPLSESKLTSIGEDYDKLVMGDEYAKAVARGKVSGQGGATQYTSFGMTGNTAMGSLKDRPEGQIAFDKDGKPFMQYGGGFKGADAAGRLAAAKRGDEYVVDQMIGGKVAPTGFKMQTDEKGNAFYVDLRPGKNYGKKRFLSTDPTSALQRSTSEITAEDLRAGKKVGAMDVLKEVNLLEGGKYLSNPGQLLGDTGTAVGNVLGGAAGLYRDAYSAVGLKGVGDFYGNAAAFLTGGQTTKQKAAAALQSAKSTAQVTSPADMAKKTPNIVQVLSPKAVATTTPSVRVGPVAPTPSVRVAAPAPSKQQVKVVGPKPAPAPKQKKKDWWNPLTWF